MANYFLRRIFFFIPALFVITLLAFIINVNAPGDPVQRLVAPMDFSSQGTGNQSQQEMYWRKKLGLDLPVFYFSVHALSEPHSLFHIQNAAQRNAAKQLIRKYGNSREILNYFKEIEIAKSQLRASVNDVSKIMQDEVASLIFVSDERVIHQKLLFIEKHDSENQISGNLKSSFEKIISNQSKWKNFIPVVKFHIHNQYHRWLFGDDNYSKGSLRGDFGISYTTREPVSKIIGERIFWSLSISLLAILLAYGLSIPIGIIAGAKKNSSFDKISSIILFVLYSLPVFWVATMLLMSFSNPDALKIFPASGVKPAQGYPDGASVCKKISITLPYLILPVICYTYTAVAFISRTLRISMMEVMSRDFIRTAYSKGLTEKEVVFKHAFRNALLPLITIFGNVFPAAISGSIIIESIFSIPGMGFETISAVHNLDYPVIVAIFTLTGALTLTGYLVSDLLYAFADPRISFAKKYN